MTTPVTSLRLAAGTLTADAAARTLTGAILPWDQVGLTSAGRALVVAGAVPVPEDPSLIPLLQDHDLKKPRGAATALSSTDAGLVGTLGVSPDDDGDQALADAASGKRKSLSVGLEIDDAEFDDDGVLVIRSARLREISQVAVAGWEGSAVTSIAASIPPGESVDADQPAPATYVRGTARPAVQAAATTRPVNATRELAGRLAAARMDGTVVALTAALADITPAGNGVGNSLAALRTQALEELWSGAPYSEKYRPLVSGGALEGAEVVGWSWSDPPVVDDYAGNKAAIPTNAAKLKVERYTPKRLAGGHDLDRIYRDLGSGDVIASYWARMVESYKRQLDLKALDLIVAAGGAAAAATSPTEALVLGTVAVEAVGPATFALVSADLWQSEMLQPADTAPVAVTQGGVYGVTLPPVTMSADLPDGTVVVGCRQAARLLTWDPPIRIEAVNIPNAGIDAGLFGYYCDIVENAGGVAAYTVAPAVPPADQPAITRQKVMA